MFSSAETLTPLWVAVTLPQASSLVLPHSPGDLIGPSPAFLEPTLVALCLSGPLAVFGNDVLFAAGTVMDTVLLTPEC